MKYIKLFRSEEEYKKSYARLYYPNLSCVKSENSGVTISRHMEQKKEGQPSNEIWYTQWDSAVTEVFSVLYRKNSPLQWPFYHVSSGYFGTDLETLEDGSDYDIYEGDKRVLKFKDNVTTIGLITDESGVTKDYGRYGWTKRPMAVDTGINEDYAGGAGAYITRVKTMSLPDSIETIGEGTFRSCWIMEDIKLPSSLKEIGKYAFNLCFNLSGITIPETVETIGEEAFSTMWHSAQEQLYGLDTRFMGQYYTNIYGDRYGLASIELPDSVKNMGPAVFEGDKAIKKAKLSRGCTYVPERTFKNCTGLNTFELNDNVTNIGTQAFWGCTSLSAITLPETLTYVGDYAFKTCKELTDISIPPSLKALSDSMFEECQKLTGITMTRATTEIGDYTFKDCTSLKSLDFLVPGISKLGEGDFSGCHSLTSLDSFPTWMDYIPNETFSNCRGLKSVKIPSWVTKLGYHTFDGCENLTDVTMPTGITTIPGFFLANCTSLSAYTVPEQITSIEMGAFYNCTNLSVINFNHNSALTIGDQVRFENGEGVFENCTSLREVTLPSTLKSIQSGGWCGSAFEGCTNLERIIIEGEDRDNFGDCFKTIPFEIKGNYMLYHAPLNQETIEVSSAITYIGEYAFYDNTGVKKIILPESVNQISIWAFAGCENLESLEIRNSGVTFTSDKYDSNSRYGIFYDVPCEVYTNYSYFHPGNKKDVVINYGIEKIDKEAFDIHNGVLNYIVDVKNVTIPNTVKVIGNLAFYQAKLDSIKFNATEEEILSMSGKTYSGEKECQASTELLIGTSAFESAGWHGYEIGYNGAVKGFEVPENTTYIGNRGFCGCRNLEKIVLPENLTHLGSEAFYNCTSASEITIKTHNLTRIETRTFSGCESVSAVTIPNSINYLSLQAFEKCTNLECVNFESGSSLTTVGEDCFYLCKNLKEIHLPDSVSTIAEDAFCCCTSLEYAYLGNGAKFAIEPAAFYKCCNLKKVYIPATYTSVSYVGFSSRKAFGGCYNLTEIDFGGTIAECQKTRGLYSCLAYLGLDYVDFIHCTDGDITVGFQDLRPTPDWADDVWDDTEEDS